MDQELADANIEIKRSPVSVGEYETASIESKMKFQRRKTLDL